MDATGSHLLGSSAAGFTCHRANLPEVQIAMAEPDGYSAWLAEQQQAKNAEDDLDATEAEWSDAANWENQNAQ
jgi:formylglycine-generating enzyme required for sulfatase activity